MVVENLAEQLESIRRELSRLLDLYQGSGPGEREWIIARCDLLGGEVQELFGLLKLTLLRMRDEAISDSALAPVCAAHTEEVTETALGVVHRAAQDIGDAIRLLRSMSVSPDAAPDAG